MVYASGLVTIIDLASVKLKALKPLISELSHCFKETGELITGNANTSSKNDVFAKQVAFSLFSTFA
jgi:hypothetical protein